MGRRSIYGYVLSRVVFGRVLTHFCGLGCSFSGLGEGSCKGPCVDFRGGQVRFGVSRSRGVIIYTVDSRGVNVSIRGVSCSVVAFGSVFYSGGRVSCLSGRGLSVSSRVGVLCAV